MRDFTNLGQPVGGRREPRLAGLCECRRHSQHRRSRSQGTERENLNFNGYSTGAAANQLIQANNTYQVTDTFSKVLGRTP
jgi:hypothetical protein